MPTALANREPRAPLTLLGCHRISVSQKRIPVIQKSLDESRCGDFYTFVALDSDSKPVPAHLVGKRDRRTTHRFVSDLASRIDGRVQLSSDMFGAYARAIETRFYGRVDYGRVVKSYEAESIGRGRYSPPHVIGAAKQGVIGQPDWSSICTSHVERQNLTMRMSMRRFTRLTNGFSKKVENHAAAVAVYFMYYNFARIHQTLRVTPAMEAGVSDHVWTIEEIVSLLDIETEQQVA